MSERLDRWVSAGIREEIEQRFYAKVNKQADFNHLARDPDFMAAPNRHVGLFADHGVSHVRDIAHQVIDVLEICHGVLIPHRNPQRFVFMQGYVVLLAYFHDIGMLDFSRFGRYMHPEFAAQAVFDPVLDDLIDSIWKENSGGLAWHLRTLVDEGVSTQEPMMVLRELLSLSIGHSKSKISVDILNDPVLLREKLIKTITTGLRTLYVEQQIAGEQSGMEKSIEGNEPVRPNQLIDRYSHIFPEGAYCWLVDSDPRLQALAEDAIDTVRILRAADALRKRGSVLRTSGHYQIFVDQYRGNAVYALQLGDNQLYLLELHDEISAGEANIACSELEQEGNLRVAFHRGSFGAPGAKERAAHAAATVINDIQSDVIGSFYRSTELIGLKPASEMLILLEETGDDISFPQMVRDTLFKLNPDIEKRVEVTPSLKYVHAQERERYLTAKPITWDSKTRCELLARVGRSGYPAERIDPEHAFDDVRLATLEIGEVLIEARSPSSFVYLPLGPGLKITPLGEYRSFSVQPWMLLGMTGVIRGAERNSSIVAERGLQVLIIPKSTYLTCWHHTLSLEAFRTAIAQAVGNFSSPADTLSLLEKRLLLQTVPVFKSLDQQAFTVLASRVREMHFAPDELVFEKDSIGNSLFVVVDGSLQVDSDSLILDRLGPGDVFGEMAAITPELRMASITAVTDSKLLRLDQRDLNYLIDNDSEIARGIIQALAGFLRKRTIEMAELKKQLDQTSSNRAA